LYLIEPHSDIKQQQPCTKTKQNYSKIKTIQIRKLQRPEVKGTVVAGNQEFPAMKFPTLNCEASEALVIT